MHPIAQHIETEYRQRTPKSAALFDRARQVLPGGDTRTSAYFAPYPFAITQAEGATLQDVDGNTYLDCMNNSTSLVHGNAYPPIVEAMARQAARGTAWAAGSVGQIELAELLCSRVDSLERVRFTNSGTEATLMAIRVARAFTGKEYIVKIEGGYHGTHDLVCASVGPDVDTAGPADAPHTMPQGRGLPESLMDHVLVAPYNDSDALRSILESMKGRVAAVVVEPMLGSHGFVKGSTSICRQCRTLRLSSGPCSFWTKSRRCAWTPGAPRSYMGSPRI